MSTASPLLAAWQRLSGLPGGKWTLSRFVCFKAPYFASIRPTIEALRPGRCEVSMTKRRAVTNHIGTVHAIAMCNLVELAGGSVTDVSIPASHRWIPKGMTVEYRAKAETDLRAVAELEPLPKPEGGAELIVPVTVYDSDDAVVLAAEITMWLSPKKT
ncbi:MAG: hotdog fold domain-containing protein [Salinisphaeraceae bacterium]